jgi:hypothetical protein
MIFALLATAVIVLALYRRRVDQAADDMLHIPDSESQLITNQVVVSKKLQAIDRWGKILTVVAVVYLLAIGAMYLVSIFTDTSIPSV